VDALLIEIQEALMKGKAPLVRELVEKCLSQGMEPGRIMNEGMVAAMSVIGQKFKANEMFMPEVMIAARAMNAGLEVLDPILSRGEGLYRGRLLLGTVRGDLHDVGKNMVSMMFRGGGFEVIDLGVDVPEARFVEAIKEHQPDIVGLSALLTMTVPQLRTTIQAIEEAGLRNRVIIMAGGAPVSGEYAQEIGADGWAPDAASAVGKAVELMEQKKKGD
jgi:5-methyltetrahydrofolate--homocysteine methyltransferase